MVRSKTPNRPTLITWKVFFFFFKAIVVRPSYIFLPLSTLIYPIYPPVKKKNLVNLISYKLLIVCLTNPKKKILSSSSIKTKTKNNFILKKQVCSLGHIFAEGSVYVTYVCVIRTKASTAKGKLLWPKQGAPQIKMA